MKNTDIAKIRQLLKQARKWIMEEGGVICPHKFGGCKHDNENCPIFCLDHALALFPCETCICCEEITEENAHLHRNCGK